MPEQTSNLELPYILSSQALKHITHNEALNRLDALVHLVIQSAVASPPASPAEGDCWAVADDPEGAWSGKARRIACWQEGGWIFIRPRSGWIGWFAGAARQKIWTGSSWDNLSDAGEDTVARLGIHATADTTNRLTVSSPATLFNHDGHGHQMKINKAAEGETASLLLQTDFSGRAELGLAASDDFALKVSADGSSWNTALRTEAGGAVLFPNRPVVRATYGETSLTPADGTLTGFGTLSLEQGGFALGSAVAGGAGNRLVVPVSGMYFISVNACSTDTAAATVSVSRNGASALLTLRKADAGTPGLSASALAWLDEGDWIALLHTGSAELQFGFGKTELSMALM